MEHRDTARAADLVTRSALPGTLVARLKQLRDLPEARLPSIYMTPEDSISREEDNQSDFTSSIVAGRMRNLGDSLSFRSSTNPTPRVTAFILEQQFEGVVIAVDHSSRSFIARLIDRTNHRPDEEAEIEFDEISPDDHPLIVPGALFTWDIGREQDSSRQIRRISEIRFRRIFRFSQAATERADNYAVDMLELLNEGSSFLQESSACGG